MEESQETLTLGNPEEIIIHTQSQLLDLVYAEGQMVFPAYILRAYSPSAEVREHKFEKFIHTKKNVKLVAIKKVNLVGNYAINIEFSDGHKSGIYSWVYLEDLFNELEQRQEEYDNFLKSLISTSK